MALAACAGLLIAACGSGERGTQPAFDVQGASLSDIQVALADGRVTSRKLVDGYLARIQREGVDLHAIISVNSNAASDADRLDRERAAGTLRGPLHGIPVVIKDNIDVAGLATTAGSLALRENVPAKDAPLVRRLREAGAIILAKANLSEWANIRSSDSTSGWSAVGGLTRNPHDRQRSACGSSSGSGAAIAASLGAAAVGTETDGSITCPAAMTGVVGLKPTVGLVSRSGVVPISQTQDTAGPMTHTVRDAAVLLSALAGADPIDTATRDADAHAIDYAKGLNADALKGARLGVLRFHTGYSTRADVVFEAALDVLRKSGATLIDIPTLDLREMKRHELTVLLTELKAGLNAYLATTPPAVKTRTLADLIAFNRAEPRELEWFGQDLFDTAERTTGLADGAYVQARDTAKRLATVEGIDRLLKDNGVVALIAPTTSPAWMSDLINGDHFLGSASALPAVAGYPHLTVPAGASSGLPVGLSFIGPAWSEPTLLSLGYAFEQAVARSRAPARTSQVRERGPHALLSFTSTEPSLESVEPSSRK